MAGKQWRFDADIKELMLSKNLKWFQKRGYIKPAPVCSCGKTFEPTTKSIQASKMTHALLYSNFVIDSIYARHNLDAPYVAYWTGAYHATVVPTHDGEVLFCARNCAKLNLDKRIKNAADKTVADFVADLKLINIPLFSIWTRTEVGVSQTSKIHTRLANRLTHMKNTNSSRFSNRCYYPPELFLKGIF